MNPAEIIPTTIGGKTFRCYRRDEAHLLWTIGRLKVEHSGCGLRVIQSSFNDTVAASAGTHDFGSVFDVEILGLDWWDAQRFLRAHGWAAWYRYPPTFSAHIHMVSLGYPGEVGIYVPGQVADYYAHRTGLAGHAADTSWHPADINSTIFDYDAWLEEHDMNATQDERLKAVEQATQRIEDDLATVLNVVRKKGANSWNRDVDLKALIREVLAEVKDQP